MFLFIDKINKIGYHSTSLKSIDKKVKIGYYNLVYRLRSSNYYECDNYILIRDSSFIKCNRKGNRNLHP
jgi:hypothetical protein